MRTLPTSVPRPDPAYSRRSAPAVPRARTSFLQSPFQSAVEPDSAEGGTGRGANAYAAQRRSWARAPPSHYDSRAERPEKLGERHRSRASVGESRRPAVAQTGPPGSRQEPVI